MARLEAGPVGWWWWAALVLFPLALFAASPFDLSLSIAVSNSEHAFGLIVARYGEWPGIALAVLSAAGLIAGRKSGSRWRRHRPIFAALLITVLVYPTVLVQLIKSLWGRVRFKHLKPGFGEYTPFYLPAGPGAGRSFPSGHAAMGSVGTPLPSYLWRLHRKKDAIIMGIAVMGLMVAVAWGRILAGKHFLTDVLFSMGFMTLIGPQFLRFAITRWRG